MRLFFLLISAILLVGCGSSNREAEALNNEGVAFLDNENYEKAEIAFRKAWALEDLDKELKSGIARNLCLLFSAKSQVDSALYYAQISYQSAKADSYYFYVSKAEYALLRKNINEARSWYEKAKEKNPNDMAAYNSLGMIYSGKYGYRYENIDKALVNNQKAYELAPRDPLAEALAFSLMNSDEYAKSLELWEKLRSSQPSNMEYLFHEGVALYFSGKEGIGKKQMEEAADRSEVCRKMYNEMLQE
jgi:tetratricopeptide (TPR) repeat protein